MKTAILLINLGTPDAPETGPVRRYLREFLFDGRVIDINPIGRYFLVNGIIAPLRAPKSAKIYQEVWTDKGSPLKLYLNELVDKVQTKFSEDIDVYGAMRYQNPGLDEVLAKIEKKAYAQVIILPLYAQYASSTTGSTAQRVMEIMSKWEVIPSVNFINNFVMEDSYINSVAKTAEGFDYREYDKVVFSYHGIPVRHIRKSCKLPACRENGCISEYTNERMYCYRSACYETSRKITEKLGIPKDKWIQVFQSRLGKDPWLEPYAEETVINLAKEGKKKLLFFSPAFVADCLETTVEIGVEYQEVFEEYGGEKIQLVPSLNSNDYWVDAVKEIIDKNRLYK